MMMWFLSLLILGDARFYTMGNVQVEVVGEIVRWRDLGRGFDVAGHTEGEVLGINASGVVVQRRDKRFFHRFDGTGPVTLNNIDARPLLRLAPLLQQPFLCETDRLHLWYKDRWQSFTLPVWTEYAEPVSTLDGVQGVRLFFPEMIGGEGRWWFYQPQGGLLEVYRDGTSEPVRHALSKRARVVRLGARHFWLGITERDQVAIQAADEDWRIGETVSVNNLSPYSLVIPAERGMWLLTFSDGLRDALRGWEKGLVDVEAHYVREERGRPRGQKHELGLLPVEFALTTSDSGSPKLAVSPGFAAKPIMGTEHLAILRDGSMSIIAVETGPQGSLMLREPLQNIVNVAKIGAVLGLTTRDGRFVALLGEEP
jgi:hypothetical protein